MSSDLISRSAVIDVIKRHECDTSRIAEGVMELPVAYDVDKVVEGLEDMRLKREEQLRTCADNDMADYFRCKMSAIAEVIEIVKSGGIE